VGGFWDDSDYRPLLAELGTDYIFTCLTRGVARKISSLGSLVCFVMCVSCVSCVLCVPCVPCVSCVSCVFCVSCVVCPVRRFVGCETNHRCVGCSGASVYLYQFNHSTSFDPWGSKYKFCVGHGTCALTSPPGR
jgi:hypothetical protein